MFEFSGKIEGLQFDFKTGNTVLNININEKQDVMDCFDELHAAPKLSIKIDKYRKKRSLNANNYAWELITQIANVLRANKDEIYLLMLKRYGQCEVISVKAHININGFIKYFEEFGESTINGKRFKHYKVFKGSSEFNTWEMSIFIDGIVSEAKELGIQTETPEQLAKYKNEWGV